MECVLCAMLSCIPGYYSSGCTAGSTRDATCIGCLNGPDAGMFQWISECEYECASGFYRVNGTSCMPCTKLQCAAGFYASNCSDALDTECLACNAPVSGPLNWTSGCEFVCADGYYLSSSEGCIMCSTSSCFPGFRSVACSHTEDTSCIACDSPVGEGYRWSESVQCGIECVDGYYYDKENKRCLECTARTCLAGTYTEACAKDADSKCTNCPIPIGAAYTWTSECLFSCIGGISWKNGSTCTPCSTPTCNPGTYASTCTPASDSTCVQCPGQNEGRTWTNGCDYGCLSGYYLDSSSAVCTQCSPLACVPGMQPQACTATRDAICIPCSLQPTGRFTWNSGCNFTCAGYLSNSISCMECTSPWCAPGTRAGQCSAYADAVCEACEYPLGETGSYVWTSDGICSFDCADGYFMHPELSYCVKCSADGCELGFHRVGCNSASDAVCDACVDNGEVGGTVWTNGCDFTCNMGYYLQSTSNRCAACSRPQCPPGWFQSTCNATSDSVCTRCLLSSYTGVKWVSGCTFSCNTGYFRNSEKCIACTQPQCRPGSYAVSCNATSDSMCVDCSKPLTGMYEWVAAGGSCQYVCATGYYRNGNNCLKCTTNLNCSPGFYQRECTLSEDTQCFACINMLGIGAAWSDECNFDCISGYFKTDTECIKCNDSINCSTGFYTSPCNSTHDTDCLECAAPGDAGSFTWVESNNTTVCQSTCCYGYYRPDSNTTCIPVPPPPTEPEPLAFVVVSTALAMNNTADKVCSKLPVLLQALSDAMKVVMGGENGLCFITNVTAFDGLLCVDNVCPQCENVSLALFIDLLMSQNSSNSRRLLGSGGVSLSTVSTSTSPVVSSSIQKSSPPPAELTSALTVSLVSVAPELSPSDVVAAISSVAVTPIPIVVPESSNTRDRRAMLFHAGTSVGVVLFIVAVVSILVCMEIINDSRGDRHSRIARKKREVDVVYEPNWMPSIRMRQRSKSKERMVK